MIDRRQKGESLSGMGKFAPITAHSKTPPLLIHGWSIYAHPLFLDQYENLARQVGALKAKDPINYEKKNAAKRLAAITTLAFDVIPQDPTRAEYRQGSTLGEQYKHWFRAKFFQQYRLFFRYHAQSKILVLGWVNDEDSKRAYDSDTDAYLVFTKMLKNGRPPSNWDELVAEAASENVRLTGIVIDT